MRFIFLVSFLILNCTPVFAADCDNGKQLYMPDGQLISHPGRVYLTKNITSEMNPKLRLISNHAISKKDQGEDKLLEPVHLANDQNWNQQILGHQFNCTGTLLLFDLNDYPIPWYKAMVRLTPILIWEDPNKVKADSAIGANEVYIGNMVGTFLWTFLIISLLVTTILLIVKNSHGNILYLFCQKNHRLSLSKTQIAAWTVAVGSVVLGFGLIRLEVPVIPESILALMGLSLATGGVSYFKSSNSNSGSTKIQKSDTIQPKLADLILVYDSQGSEPQPSLARAQMVFWTGMVLILFVSKSLLDGVLWQMPWELVILMGMSQAGYLSPKLFNKQNDSSETPTKL